MSLLVTGSIGIDTVRTPFGVSENCLGGSSIYFAMAAGFFTPVRFLAVVGDDCPFDLKDFFAGRAVDLEGLEVRTGSKTFRWHGTYHGNMNERTTDHVELNVLAEEPPAMPTAYKDSTFVFLANTTPALQLRLLEELDGPRLAVADTMNLWIENARDDLLELLSRINGLVLNDSEAKMLTGKENLIAAAREIIKLGPDFVLVKKGEHGTFLLTGTDECFALPAYPSEAVKDPTGAGDTFAGGMMGYLASQGNTDMETLRKAIAYGTVTASLVIEDFSLDRWQQVGYEDIEQRLQKLRKITQF